MGHAAVPHTRPTTHPSPEHPLREPLPTQISLPFPIIERRLHPRQCISGFNLFLGYFGVAFWAEAQTPFALTKFLRQGSKRYNVQIYTVKGELGVARFLVNYFNRLRGRLCSLFRSENYYHDAINTVLTQPQFCVLLFQQMNCGGGAVRTWLSKTQPLHGWDNSREPRYAFSPLS